VQLISQSKQSRTCADCYCAHPTPVLQRPVVIPDP
jgi:hypothetical protein